MCVWRRGRGSGRGMYPGQPPALRAGRTQPPKVEVTPNPLGSVLPLQAVSSSCNIITSGAASTGCGLWGRGIIWTSRWVSSPPGGWRDRHRPLTAPLDLALNSPHWEHVLVRT